MCVLSDKEIIDEIGVANGIVPFIREQVKTVKFEITDLDIGFRKVVKDEIERKVISYGLSSYGYDMRLDKHFKIFHNVHSVHVDPKNMDESSFVEVECVKPYPNNFILIPPNSFVLCQTLEWLRIPEDCLAFVAAKSTYARCGIVVNATVLEPGWEGTVTLELSNTTTLPARVYVGEGIVQVVYIRGSEKCDVSYADRHGKYMNQSQVTLSKV